MLTVFLDKIILPFKDCLVYFYSLCKDFLHLSKPSENHTKSKQRIELLRNKFPGAPDHWLEKIGDCEKLQWLEADLKGTEPLHMKVPLLSSKALPLNKETDNAKNDDTKGEINEGRSYHQAHLPQESKHMPSKVQGEESKKKTSLKSFTMIKFLEVKSKTAVKNNTLDGIKESNTENKEVRVIPNLHKRTKRPRLFRAAVANRGETKGSRTEKQGEFSAPFKSTKKRVSSSNAERETREKRPGKSCETINPIKKYSIIPTLRQSSDCEAAQLSKDLKRKKCKERLRDEKKRHNQRGYRQAAFREREPGFPNMPGQKIEGNSQKYLDRWPSLPETEDFFPDEGFDLIGLDVEEISWSV